MTRRTTMTVTLNRGQKKAKKGILQFLQQIASKQKGQDNSCYLWGYAGTGKTMLTSMILDEIIDWGIKVCITAPTHKALGVIQSDLMQLNPRIEDAYTFSTLHSALSIVPIVDIETGKLLFTCLGKGKKEVDEADDGTESKAKSKLDLIVVDESSMLNKSMVNQLINNDHVHYLFLGDDAQLPPVGEEKSIIFQQSERSANRYLLTEIMRTASKAIKTIATTTRSLQPWNIDQLMRCVNEAKRERGSVAIYQTKWEDPSESKWYKYMMKHLDSSHPPIILAWRNRQVDRYNSLIRAGIHGGPVGEAYLPGDHVLFNDYHRPDDWDVDSDPMYTGNHGVVLSLYTKRETVAHWPPYTGKRDSPATAALTRTRRKLAAVPAKFKVDYLTLRVRDGEEIQVASVNREHIDDYWKSHEQMCELIRQYYVRTGSAKQTKGLWEEMHKQTTRRLANLTYSYSITVHKAQGTTYQDVLVDLDDICDNPRVDEMRSELYTAVTRAARRLILLCQG